MKTIDRYLLRQFVQTFVICYVSLAGLYIVIDAFTHLEEFFACSKATGRHFASLMATFYGHRAILFFGRTSGLLTLVSAMFTLAWIQRHNEMTALQAAGISRLRVAAPMIVAAAVISLLAAANRELVIPRFRDELNRRHANVLGRQGEELQSQRDARTGVRIGGEAAFPDGMRIERPVFEMPRGFAHVDLQLTAAEAFYRPADGERPGGYLLCGELAPADLAQRPSVSWRGSPLLITPRDAPDWLKADQVFVASELDFKQLTRGRTSAQYSSTAEMIAGLQNPSADYSADVKVEIHGRFVSPLLDMTLLFLGLPLVLSRENRNVFVAAGLCICVVALFMLVMIGFRRLGMTGWMISPALAVWIPLMLFVPPAAAMAGSMRR